MRMIKVLSFVLRNSMDSRSIAFGFLSYGKLVEITHVCINECVVGGAKAADFRL